MFSGHRFTLLSRYKDRLADWCQQRIRSKDGYDLLRCMFAYDPEKRLDALEALDHKWFKEEPIPSQKYVTP